MRLVVQAAPAAHYLWLALQSGTELTEGFRAIEVLDEDQPEVCPFCRREHGRIRGMTGYSAWTPNSVTMHVAMDETDRSDRREAATAIIPEAFRYPFEERGLKIVLAGVLSSNAKSLALCRRLGFREVHRVPQGWDDETDLILLEMRRDECQWVRR